MSNLSPEQARLDPYSRAAENTDLTLQEKITGTYPASHQKLVHCTENSPDLHSVVKTAGVGMLVTRDANGNLHSRAMTPASRMYHSFWTIPSFLYARCCVSAHSETQLNLVFLANNVSHKFEEIQNDAHVNVSFCDPSSSDWASYSGRAK